MPALDTPEIPPTPLSQGGTRGIYLNRLASLRLAPLRLALLRQTLLGLAPFRSTITTSLSLTPLRLASLKSIIAYDLKTHSDFRYIGCCQQKSQGQSIAFSHQVYGAAFAFPAVGDILAPVWAGTKLPSRKAWLQSSLPCWSRVPKNLSQICSQTPCSCHPWRRR